MKSTRRPLLFRVAGGSGIGKSTLVAHYLEALDGAVILQGRCYERENVPFKALDAIVDALARQLSARGAPAPEHVGDLCRIFPPLGRVFSDTAVTADPRLARQRAITTLTLLLSQLTATDPLVISIDDLQWGDRDSGVMMGALLEAALPVLWIVTYRSGERCALADALATHPGSHLVVESLDASDGATLVRAMVGEVDETVVQTIIAEAGGNPFFMGELARGSHGGHVDLGTLVQQRVSLLDEAPRRLLEVIALAGALIAIGTAIRAAGLADATSLVTAAGINHRARGSRRRPAWQLQPPRRGIQARTRSSRCQRARAARSMGQKPRRRCRGRCVPPQPDQPQSQ